MDRFPLQETKFLVRNLVVFGALRLSERLSIRTTRCRVTNPIPLPLVQTVESAVLRSAHSRFENVVW